MAYPTVEQVDAADHEQICRWWRFLKSPGMAAIETPDFEARLQAEAAVMDRIAERLKEFGGFTPQISKRIGWDHA